MVFVVELKHKSCLSEKKKRVVCCLGLGLWIATSLFSDPLAASAAVSRTEGIELQCDVFCILWLPFSVIFGHKKHHSNHDGQVWHDSPWTARCCNLLSKNCKIRVQDVIKAWFICDSHNSCAIQAQNWFNPQFVLPSWRIILYCIARIIQYW